jgi:hypothetical protein
MTPSSAVIESADERNGTMRSRLTSTPAVCSGLAMPTWMWLPTAVAMPMDRPSGSFLSAATRSDTESIGESARTATTIDSSRITAMGVAST